MLVYIEESMAYYTHPILCKHNGSSEINTLKNRQRNVSLTGKRLAQ